MRRVERQIAKNKRTMDQLSQATEKTGTAADKAKGKHAGFASKLGTLAGGIGSMKTALLGLVGAYAAVSAAQKAFKATVGTSMEREQAMVMISSMMQDKKNADAYMKVMQDLAIKSPVLDTQEMFNNSAGYLTITKDVKQLEKLWQISEKLIALNPQRGTEDAAFSLRELLASGDAISIIDRFNLDRGTMNVIKDVKDVDKQLQMLDDYLVGMGVTAETISNAGDTALGKWQQVKEAFREKFLLDVGNPSLEPIKKFFDDLLKRMDGADFKKFGQIGGKVMQSVVNGLTTAVVDIYDWFTNLVNSDEFKEQTTVYGKVSFVIDDIYKKFLEWLENGGSEKIEATAKVLLESLAAAIDSSDVLVKSAVKMGGAIGKGVIDGFNEAINDSMFLSVTKGAVTNDPVKAGKNYGVNAGIKWGIKKFGLEPEDESGSSKKKKKPPGNNGGLAYVPYNGYEASLHKGEQILTRGEADDYRAGKAGKGSVVISGNQFIVREEADINKIAHKLANLIEASGGAGAYNGA